MQQELLHHRTPEFAESDGLVPNLFGVIELVLLIRLFSTSLVEHENRLSSRFNAEELSRVAPMLQSKYGGDYHGRAIQNSRRFQLVRINDHGSQGSQELLHETVRLDDRRYEHDARHDLHGRKSGGEKQPCDHVDLKRAPSA